MADRYVVYATFYHSLPGGYSVIDAWPLKSQSLGLRNNDFPLPQFPNSIDVVSFNDTSIILKTYVYDVHFKMTGNPGISTETINDWLVFDENLTDFPYALHITSPTAGIEQVQESYVQLYPNPTKNFVNFTIPESEIFNYFLMDINGKILQNGKITTDNLTLDLTSLPSSVYLIKVFNEKSNRSFKVLKY